MGTELITQEEIGQPFKSGNRGRPVGSKGKATLLMEAIKNSDPDALQSIVNKTVEAAKAGKPWAVQLLMDRLFPVPRGRLVEFPMPALNTLADIKEVIGAVLQAASDGILTVEEAGMLAATIDRYAVPIIEASDVDARLKLLEHSR
jgi:hypothetical protein